MCVCILQLPSHDSIYGISQSNRMHYGHLFFSFPMMRFHASSARLAQVDLSTSPAAADHGP